MSNSTGNTGNGTSEAQSGETESFPRLSARTQRFTLGRPRSVRVAADGSRVLFLRSSSGTDAVNALWTISLGSQGKSSAPDERMVADPRELLADPGAEDLPAQERARRERAREGAGGIVAYATDRLLTVAAFSLSGRLFAADLRAGTVTEVATPGPIVDPRPDPKGARVAFVCDGALHVADLATGARTVVADDVHPDITWGLAEFIAAEEMGRLRGYWWAPDGQRLLVARVDESHVQQWHIADPAKPEEAGVLVRYPAAGTTNATVTMALVDLAGHRQPIELDADTFPYIASVSWDEGAGPLVVTQSRDQRRMRVTEIDVSTGATTILREDYDETWVDIVPGLPGRLADGRLVWSEFREGTRRLLFGDEAVTPVGLELDEVVHVGPDGVLISATDEPTELHIFRVGADASIERLTRPGGVHAATAGGDVVVVSASRLDEPPLIEVRVPGREPLALASHAMTPPFAPRVELLRAGARELRTAVLFPRDAALADGPLPVLLDPYGGPHALRVLSAGAAFLSSQWFADQGFAVVVADGRGTPLRGHAWERAVVGDLATPALDDQVDALAEVLARYGDRLDAGRVGIRGWSFGGYLAALAVLRRPDVFHAAIAGAPVTDWTLYDTHYTERYLGDPATSPEAYQRSSLLSDAPNLRRPLLLIHGLADDNVVSAHTLRLSGELLAAGRSHCVLPLSGVSHMTPQEVVAENLLLLQVDFLRTALRAPARLDERSVSSR